MKKRVLVIDDDADTRSLLAAVLSDFPVEVVEASQDEEGYQRFLELGPDLILLDVLLPRQGGLSLLRKIRGVRGGKDVPVLVMSAVYRSGDVRAEAVEQLGALDFVKKPFQMETLRARLSSVLGDEHAEEAESAEAFNSSEILVRGDLANVDFPALLKDFAFHRATGRLNVRRESVKKIIFFQEGEIVFALSNQIRDTLGRYLYSSGRVSEEDYRAGLEAMQKGGSRMGEFLIQREALPAQAVYEAIRNNVLEKVLDLFTWPSGDFLLGPYAEPPAPLPGQPFELSRVIWEGVRGHFPYERITAALSPHGHLSLEARRDVFDLAGDVPLDKVDLQFLRLLNRLKGQPLSKALASIQGEGELRFLYFLLLQGYLGLTRAAGGSGRYADLPDLERIRRARRRLDAIRARNYFQVLEVPLDSSDEKVRESYLRLAKEVHPDMLGLHDPAELHRLYGEAFQVVQSAYEALKTEPRRKEYLRFIQKGLADEVSDGSKILEAETRFMEGKAHLKRQASEEAVRAFRAAVTLNPDEGEYLLWLGIALSRSLLPGDDKAFGEIEELLRQAATRLPTSPEPCYRMGKLYAGRGETEKARGYFQAALARDAHHTDSLRELRLIRLRSDKKEGMFTGLLGRKGAKS